MRPRPWTTARRAPLVHLVSAALLLPLLAGCPADSLRSGGAEGDGVREGDTARLRELPGVQDALVTTVPVEDSDYSITRAAVDVEAGASAEQVAAALAAVADLEAVDGRTLLTVGAGSVEVDEDGDFVEVRREVSTIEGTGEDDVDRERAATMVVEGAAIADGPVRVEAHEELTLDVYVAPEAGVDEVARVAVELIGRDFPGVDQVSVLGEGALTLASGDQGLDAVAVGALTSLVPGTIVRSGWWTTYPAAVSTTPGGLDVDLQVVVAEGAPARLGPRDREQVWSWLRSVLDVMAVLPAGSGVGAMSRPGPSGTEGRDPLRLGLSLRVPDVGDPPPAPSGDPLQDRAAAYLHDQARAAGRPG